MFTYQCCITSDQLLILSFVFFGGGGCKEFSSTLNCNIQIRHNHIILNILYPQLKCMPIPLSPPPLQDSNFRYCMERRFFQEHTGPTQINFFSWKNEKSHAKPLSNTSPGRSLRMVVLMHSIYIRMMHINSPKRRVSGTLGEAILNLKGQIDSLLPEGPVIICFIIPLCYSKKK